MAQTANAIPMSCARVRVSTNGTAWTNISGSTNAVNPGDATRMSGETYTFDGLGAIVKAGKMEPQEVEVTIVYTELNTEAYEIAQAVFEQVGCAPDFYVRWSPGGGDVGDEEYEAYGPIVKFFYPPVSAGEAGPIVGSFTVKAGRVTHITLTT